MTTLAVRKPEALAPGLDPKPLFELGLREVRAYARAGWTDHNIHDPGITTLELLCYALTDIAYRACHPVEDLLAVPGDNAAAMAEHFFSARRALPNAPVTELDYRRLMLDVQGVRNAWLYPVEPLYFADAIEGKLRHEKPELPGVREVRLRGLHGVLLEYVDGAPPAERARIEAEVMQALMANRCLCEDFVAVAAVEPQDFLLCAEIELEPNADPLEAHATISLAVQRYLAPGVPRYTREQMLARYTDPELFEGPAPRNGFTDPDELAAAELRATIRLSDVVSEIMDVPGVRAVRDVVIRAADLPEGAPAESKWEVSVQPGRRARLDAAASRLVLYKGAMPLPRHPDVVARFLALKAEDERRYAARPSGERPIPLGRWRAGDYASVQKHFPSLYGIGDAALPAGAGAERRAQALQLEGWLAFFDQLLANDCAQLASVRELFALDTDPDHSYFSEPVEELRELYPRPAPAQAAAEAGEGEAARNAWRLRIRTMLDALAESRPAMLARRNRFLDHLMARFAERLQDYLAIQAALFGATPAAAVHAKCVFLAQYPELGAARGLGFNHAREAAGNVSGLEKRLVHLLGLGTLAYEIYQERDEDGIDEYRFRVRRRFTAGVLLSSTRHWSTAEEAYVKLNEAITAAARPSGYRRTQTVTGEHTFNIVDAGGQIVARRIQYFATPELRDAAIEELIAVVAGHLSERLCLVENILLRPRPGTSADAFLPVCADPDCGPGCPGDDPYSYRLHIVLPAEAGRFASMDFRRFAEDVIRQETPAHLAPKVCWVSNADMTRIELAWAAWRALLAGSDTTARAAKFAELRDALYQAKNAYPQRTLADCEAPEKFILGRSALGSLTGESP
jgi:uncharacterized protein